MNLPENYIGSATSKARKDTTPENGERGALDNLDEAIKNNPKIAFV
jgi:hypothetical protein